MAEAYPVESARGRLGDEHSTQAGSWLIVGHGTVGSVLSERILVAGGQVKVRDDEPRIAVAESDDIHLVGHDERVEVDHVAVCVPHQTATAAAAYLQRVLSGKPVILDWASAPPEAKIAAADPAVGDWIDVALLDSLDRPLQRPLLAISGSRHEDATTALHALGFDVAVAGDAVGDAAAVKLTRSLFMKSIESLVMEYRGIASSIDPAGAAWLSIERSLGGTFTAFADVLVTSNAIHAGRRAGELDHTLAFANEHGFAPPIAGAAADVLHRLARFWADNPQPRDADVQSLLERVRPVFAR